MNECSKFRKKIRKTFFQKTSIEKKTNVFTAMFINISKNAILLSRRRNIDIAVSMIEFIKI